ncbi:MAG: hypothetical protein WCP06_12925 [Verrucomicrobiota bacterium]
MKLAPIFALLLLPLAAFGKDTAYQALRAIGTVRNPALLNRVLEVKGRSGDPQPELWTILLDDQLARGGVREIEVSNGRIVSERTPVKTYSGSAAGIAMNFQKLNLDSEGAFAIAETEAKNASLGFDSVDYNLHCEDAASAPTWVIQLLDSQQRSVGSVTIAADTGTVLAKDLGDARQDGDRASETGEKAGGFSKFQHDVKRSFLHVGGDLEKFFTGRRTIDR